MLKPTTDGHEASRGLSATAELLIMPPRVGRGSKRCFCPSVTYIPNNSRTRMPSMPKFGRKVPHLRCDSRTSFKSQRSRSPSPLMVTHDFQCKLTAYTAGCCCLAYFVAIFVSICTKLARSILMRDCNIATEPNFRRSFLKSRILSSKNSYLSISVA